MGNGLLVGSAALVVWGFINTDDIDQSALDDWWTNEHLPERLSIPGFLRAHRYFNQHRNEANYLTLYETESLDTLTSDAYMEKLNNPTPGTQKHIPTLATMQRSACQVLSSHSRKELKACGNGAGGAISMVVLSLPSNEYATPDLKPLTAQIFRDLQDTHKDLMGFHIFKEDAQATKPGSSSQSYLNGNLQSGDDTTSTTTMVVFEHSSPARPPIVTGGTPILGLVDAIKDQFGRSIKISAQIYNFMCCVSR